MTGISPVALSVPDTQFITSYYKGKSECLVCA